MILDAHIHLGKGADDREDFRRKSRAAGVDGGVVISLPPAAFPSVARTAPPAERVRHVLWWCQAGPDLYPFYWIDPTEPDAQDQVRLAVDHGIAGFKVICGRHAPGDPRAMPVYRRIAAAGRPILFHSGILWDGQPSSVHNRPAAFEDLLEVEGLRFALAHISWPWCDECIAVYGKFLNARGSRPELSVEMFVDTTPGTPPIYRRDALTRLFTVYDASRNVLFGSDGRANDYHSSWAAQWIERDRAIYRELGLTPEVVQNVFADNLRRFLGLTTPDGWRPTVRPGE